MFMRFFQKIPIISDQSHSRHYVTLQVVDKFGLNLSKLYSRHPERSEGSPESGSAPRSLRSFATLVRHEAHYY